MDKFSDIQGLLEKILGSDIVLLLKEGFGNPVDGVFKISILLLCVLIVLAVFEISMKMNKLIMDHMNIPTGFKSIELIFQRIDLFLESRGFNALWHDKFVDKAESDIDEDVDCRIKPVVFGEGRVYFDAKYNAYPQSKTDPIWTAIPMSKITLFKINKSVPFDFALLGAIVAALINQVYVHSAEKAMSGFISRAMGNDLMIIMAIIFFVIGVIFFKGIRLDIVLDNGLKLTTYTLYTKEKMRIIREHLRGVADRQMLHVAEEQVDNEEGGGRIVILEKRVGELEKELKYKNEKQKMWSEDIKEKDRKINELEKNVCELKEELNDVVSKADEEKEGTVGSEAMEESEKGLNVYVKREGVEDKEKTPHAKKDVKIRKLENTGRFSKNRQKKGD